jgi:hypothetical protein
METIGVRRYRAAAPWPAPRPASPDRPAAGSGSCLPTTADASEKKTQARESLRGTLIERGDATCHEARRLYDGMKLAAAEQCARKPPN